MVAARLHMYSQQHTCWSKAATERCGESSRNVLPIYVAVKDVSSCRYRQ